MSFLNAEWRKLVLVNYAVSPEVLTAHIPFGTQLDLWNGTCYLSLVGFMFRDTRLLGVRIPFHVHFEEVNLRFYVTAKRGGEIRRGVVFIKEIVPRPAITFVANTVYKEHYQTLPMWHAWEELDDRLQISYGWKTGSEWQEMSVIAESGAMAIPRGSETEFITEHYWGYSRLDDRRTIEYEVTHPRWLCYPVLDHSVEVDFQQSYGEEFAFLNELEPTSVMLAEGSAITVEHKRRL